MRHAYTSQKDRFHCGERERMDVILSREGGKISKREKKWKSFFFFFVSFNRVSNDERKARERKRIFAVSFTSAQLRHKGKLDRIAKSADERESERVIADERAHVSPSHTANSSLSSTIFFSFPTVYVWTLFPFGENVFSFFFLFHSGTTIWWRWELLD